METLYTIGHSTRTGEEFLALLRAHGIRRLVDVRRAPGSRRHPHFGRDALAATLAAAGIGYRHEEAMGGRRADGYDAARSPNGGWRHPAFRAYADHLATPAFAAAVARLRADAAAARTVVMCAEARPADCHRQLIADALVARGVRVLHVVSLDEPRPHVLNPRAVVLPGGGVVYPPGPAGQGDLFGG